MKLARSNHRCQFRVILHSQPQTMIYAVIFK